LPLAYYHNMCSHKMKAEQTLVMAGTVLNTKTL